MSDPLEKQRLLAKAVQKVADELELDLHRLAIVPSHEEGGSDFMEVVLQLRTSSVMGPEERESYKFAKDMETQFLIDLAKPDITPQLEAATEELGELRKGVEGWLE